MGNWSLKVAETASAVRNARWQQRTESWRQAAPIFNIPKRLGLGQKRFQHKKIDIAIIYNHTHPIPNLNPESRTFAMEEQRGYLRTCKYFASSFGRLGRIQERYQEVVLSSKSHPKPCTEAPVHTSCREVRLD